jgi:stage IV sporulation protein FB
VEPLEPEHTNENEPTENSDFQSSPSVLPKPILMQNEQNWVRKSLVSLAIYGFLFLFIFKTEPIYIAAVLLVLLIHEFGHFFAMKAFNYTNVKLFVLPLLGAYVTGKKTIISQRQMAVVVLAGPVPGIIFGMGLLLFTDHYPNERLDMLGKIFLGLNFFNLLPFMPLDGGRLLETLFINHNHVLRVVFTSISILVLLLLALLLKSPFFLIIPVSMVFDLIMEVKNQKIRTYLIQEKIDYITDYSHLSDRDYWTIRDCIILSFNKRYKGLQAGVHQYSVIEGGLIQHVVAVLKTPIIKDLKIVGTLITFLIFIFFLLLPIVYYIPKIMAAILFG